MNIENNKNLKSKNKDNFASHNLAALSDIENTLPESQVTIPSLESIIEAKRFVDEHNQK